MLAEKGKKEDESAILWPQKVNWFLSFVNMKITRVLFATSGFETQLGSFLASQFTIWKKQKQEM